MVEQSGKPFLLPCSCCCCTPRNPCDTRSPLCVGLVLDRTMFSLVRALPSPTSAAGCPPLFGWFIGTTTQSDSSGAYMPALWLVAFADRPRSSSDPGTPEISRFCACCFSGCAGSQTTQGRLTTRDLSRPAMLPSPNATEGRRPEQDFSKLNHPAHRCPCLRFG